MKLSLKLGLLVVIVFATMKFITYMNAQTVKATRIEHKTKIIDNTTDDTTMSDWAANTYVIGSAIKNRLVRQQLNLVDSMIGLRTYINGLSFITKDNLSVTTTGIGAASYNSTTGVFNIPTPKRVESYSGTTDGSGNYTVTFSNSFSSTPRVFANIYNPGSDLYFCKVTSISTTGCTVNAYGFSSISSLPIIGALAGALVGVSTSPVSGATIQISVIEQ